MPKALEPKIFCWEIGEKKEKQGDSEGSAEVEGYFHDHNPSSINVLLNTLSERDRVL
jgi:hypothetical protein